MLIGVGVGLLVGAHAPGSELRARLARSEGSANGRRCVADPSTSARRRQTSGPRSRADRRGDPSGRRRSPPSERAIPTVSHDNGDRSAQLTATRRYAAVHCSGGVLVAGCRPTVTKTCTSPSRSRRRTCHPAPDRVDVDGADARSPHHRCVAVPGTHTIDVGAGPPTGGLQSTSCRALPSLVSDVDPSRCRPSDTDGWTTSAPFVDDPEVPVVGAAVVLVLDDLVGGLAARFVDGVGIAARLAPLPPRAAGGRPGPAPCRRCGPWTGCGRVVEPAVLARPRSSSCRRRPARWRRTSWPRR